MREMTILWIFVGLVLGVGLGYLLFDFIFRGRLGKARESAEKIIQEARREAEAKKKEALIEAKDEAFRIKSEAEREVKERRAEIQRLEKRVLQKESILDRRLENLERREKNINAREQELNQLRETLIKQIEAEKKELERVSGMTQEQAREILLKKTEEEYRHDLAKRMKELEDEIREEAESKARDILLSAIQRTAVDHATEATVSVVPIPSDDMKGRIIGREGRNIRAFETITGVDVVIDDTPEAVTLSAFDPVRREVARIALEKLIMDGRIHPARIEEMVEKAQKEVDERIKEEGERAVMETSVRGLHPDLVKTLGRLYYRTSYGQNVLQHSIEVAHLAALMASELKLDPTIAVRSGLLHDIGKALSHEYQGSHAIVGADLLRKYNEPEEVIHAVAAHHGDIEQKSVYPILIQLADTISAARPGARRESLETYIKRLESLESIADSFPGVEKAYAIQAGREIRIMVKPDQIDDVSAVKLAHDITKKVEQEMVYPGQIKVTVIREVRAVDYAK
ncbi:MAG: ribonuclease Y [Caldiserica bacterium]|jgi:ribonuclease Y|nr:ribonuclease Y [Caldisericota bacterium]MDH7562345.1 ribonuclease Y [Caldisericota bacterium]